MRNIVKATVLCFAALALTACEQIWDTADTILEVRGEITTAIVDNSVEGAQRYCRTIPPERRESFREQVDVDGLGPVIQVNCENFAEFAGNEEFGGGGGP